MLVDNQLFFFIRAQFVMAQPRHVENQVDNETAIVGNDLSHNLFVEFRRQNALKEVFLKGYKHIRDAHT